MTLKANHIYVWKGELLIGWESLPFTNQAVIELYGVSSSSSTTWNLLIEAGDWAIVNTGIISMYGKVVSTLNRLTSTANVGATTINVDPL